MLHTCSQPWMDTSPGHPTHLCPHRPSQAVQVTIMAHLGMDVALSLSLGLAGADLLLPSLWPKSNIQSVCCLHSYILTALPPESFATNTNILGASAKLCFLLPFLPAPCWSCPCHTASCCLLQDWRSYSFPQLHSSTGIAFFS